MRLRLGMSRAYGYRRHRWRRGRRCGGYGCRSDLRNLKQISDLGSKPRAALSLTRGIRK